MTRSLVFALAGCLAAACSGATPAPIPTASPASSASLTATATATAIATAPAPPTATPAAGSLPPNVRVGGTSWGASVAQLGATEGDRFVFECPPGGSSEPVWGTDTYTSDSSVCTAAVHAGLITFEAGGAVGIEIRPGQDSYLGSERNGVSTNQYGSWSQSFAFVNASLPQATRSPAASASPSPSPIASTPSSPGVGYGADALIFSDDFSDTSSGWQTDTSDNGSVEYGSGALQASLNAAVSYLSLSGPISDVPYDVVRVEATLTAAGGTAANYVGLLCGLSADDLAGAALGTDGTVAFVRRNGSGYEALQTTNIPLLANGQPARLTLECAGSNTGPLRLRVWFNGAPVDEYVAESDGPAAIQRVALYVEGTAGSVFTMDDVSVFGGLAANLPPLAETPAPNATPTAAVQSPAGAAYEQLLTHIQSTIRNTCSEVDPAAAGALAVANCQPEDVISDPNVVVDDVVYISYATLAEATARYGRELATIGDQPGDDCSLGPSQVAYEIDGAVHGRLLCAPDIIFGDQLVAWWYDDRLNLVGSVLLSMGTYADLFNVVTAATALP